MGLIVDSLSRTSYAKRVICSLFIVLFYLTNAFADGTKQVSPGNGAGLADANGTSYFVSPLTPQGSWPGSAAQTKLRVTILDHTIENIYSGFMARTFSNTKQNQKYTYLFSYGKNYYSFRFKEKFNHRK